MQKYRDRSLLLVDTIHLQTIYMARHDKLHYMY